LLKTRLFALYFQSLSRRIKKNDRAPLTGYWRVLRVPPPAGVFGPRGQFHPVATDAHRLCGIALINAFVTVRSPMNIRPLYDRVIIKRVSAETTSKGGIIIPDSAKEKPIEGEVIAVGNGKRADDGSLLTLEVKAGDRVLFGKYSGTEVKVGGEDRVILREDEILAIIER